MSENLFPFFTTAQSAGFMGICVHCGEDILGTPVKYWIMQLERGNRQYCSRECMEHDPQMGNAADRT